MTGRESAYAVPSRTRAAGRISLDTDTAGGGCTGDYTWKAARR